MNPETLLETLKTEIKDLIMTEVHDAIYNRAKKAHVLAIEDKLEKLVEKIEEHQHGQNIFFI